MSMNIGELLGAILPTSEHDIGDIVDDQTKIKSTEFSVL